MSWWRGFEAIVRPEVPLGPHTWYKLGGPAAWLCEPRNPPELAALLARLRDAGVLWRVLGCGANVLVSDEGWRGAVIHLAGDFARVELTHTVTAAAGADFPRLIRRTIRSGLVGLEVLAGIPGSVGGLIRMNAGGKYGEVGQFVRDVTLLDRHGNLVERTAAEVGFRYRHTDLDGCIVLAARFALARGDAEAALRRHRAIWQEKYASQPPVSERSAGCIFKNPAGHSAGRLLDQAGLKGVRVGGAEISARHANFIVAHEGATAGHVIDLIRLAQDRVWNTSGIKLELEIDIW